MDKKRRVIAVFKYISLGISVLTYGFILFQSSLSYEESSKWANWAKDIWKTVLNDTLDLKENSQVIKPENLKLELSNYKYNSITQYEENEIPVGCVKQLNATILPENASNKLVTFSASPSENVNLVANGNIVTAETLKTGELTITAKSVADNSIVKEYKFSVVDKKAPTNFTVTENEMSLVNGYSKDLGIDFEDDKITTDLMKLRYYDCSKLNITSSNEDVAVIRGTYVKAIGVGEATITISNGSYTKTSHVTVTNNPNPIIPVDDLEITGNNEVHIMDVNGDIDSATLLTSTFKNSEPTDKGVIWSVNNPAAAIIDQTGRVYGYRKVDSENDYSFKVRATSVDNPNKFVDYDMKLCHILPTSLSFDTKMSKDDEGNYILGIGKTGSLKVLYGPESTSKVGYSISTTNTETFEISQNDNSVDLVGLKEGKAQITIISSYDENVKTETINIVVMARNYINEDNEQGFTFNVRKYISGHAFLFMIAGIFTTLYIFMAHFDKPHRIKFTALLMTPFVGFFFAGLSEFIQLFIPRRNGSWSDIWIDLNGYGIGALIIWIFVIIYTLVCEAKSKRNKEKAKDS